MSDYVPHDLLSDILSRLDVKSLICLRCVCKEWCTMIDSSSFVKQHLTRSALNKTKHKVLLENGHYLKRYNKETGKSCLDRHFNLWSVGLFSLHQTPLKLDRPRKYLPRTKNLGSCNGLICLLSKDLGDRASSEVFVVWNPSIRKHINLPVPLSENYSNAKLLDKVYGFGYEPVFDDYKVAMLVQYLLNENGQKSYQTELNVYSLSSNSWTKTLVFLGYQIYFKKEPRLPGTLACGALACGALHWVVGKHDVQFNLMFNSIFALDLLTQEYKIFSLPDDVVHIRCAWEFGGCLSILCDEIEFPGFSMWVMKNYGVRESWTKLLAISDMEIIKSIDFGIPLAYSEMGDEVLMMANHRQFLWYNLEERTVKFIDACGSFRNPEPVSFFESLVSLGRNAENDAV